MKNLTVLRGNLNKVKGKLKQQLAVMLASDSLLAEGKKEELLGRLQAKLGRTKEEFNKFSAIKKHIPNLIKF